MNKEHIQEIKARCEAATPGPWKSSREDMDSFAMHCDSNNPDMMHVVYVYRYAALEAPRIATLEAEAPRIAVFGGDGDNARADARFIAHARQDIPVLLAYIEELKAELEKVA